MPSATPPRLRPVGALSGTRSGATICVLGKGERLMTYGCLGTPGAPVGVGPLGGPSTTRSWRSAAGALGHPTVVGWREGASDVLGRESTPPNVLEDVGVTASPRGALCFPTDSNLKNLNLVGDSVSPWDPSRGSSDQVWVVPCGSSSLSPGPRRRRVRLTRDSTDPTSRGAARLAERGGGVTGGGLGTDTRRRGPAIGVPTLRVRGPVV